MLSWITKKLKKRLATLLIVCIVFSQTSWSVLEVQASYDLETGLGQVATSSNSSEEDVKLKEGQKNQTTGTEPSDDATPSDATPSGATPSDATPSDATPSDATESQTAWRMEADNLTCNQGDQDITAYTGIRYYADNQEMEASLLECETTYTVQGEDASYEFTTDIAGVYEISYLWITEDEATGETYESRLSRTITVMDGLAVMSAGEYRIETSDITLPTDATYYIYSGVQIMQGDTDVTSNFVNDSDKNTGLNGLTCEMTND